MLDKYLKIETLSIVFLGVFNPVIFQPTWLSSKKIVRDEEAEKATVDIIHQDIVKYSLGGWLDVDIIRNRCEFRTTKEPYFDSLRDLALNVFKILKETPINSVGLNHIFEISLPSEQSYYDFGNSLAPLKIWDKEMNAPRLLNLEILEKSRFDKKDGSRRIRITPSDQKISYGIAININDNFLFGKNVENSELFYLIENYWNKSREYSKELADNILKKLI